jgi:hypothetical protein
MAVIVDHEFVAHMLGIKPRPGSTEGSEAHGDVEQSVDARPQGRQRWRAIDERQRPR